MAVVGAGYIGLELGMAFARLGARVAVVEAAGRILPGWHAELTRPVQRSTPRRSRRGLRAHGLPWSGSASPTSTRLSAGNRPATAPAGPFRTWSSGKRFGSS